MCVYNDTNAKIVFKMLQNNQEMDFKIHKNVY